MNRWTRHVAAIVGAWLAAVFPAAGAEMIVAVGAAGEPQYGEAFERQAEAWTKAGTAAGWTVRRSDAKSDLMTALQSLPAEGDAIWLVLIGHGSYDGRNARFNLTGDDLAAEELAAALARTKRRVVVLALFSASGAWAPELSGDGRVIITATRSGAERNYARFGEHLATALGDAAADLDGDGQASLLELGVLAARRTTEFYDNEQRLVPEHAAVDENGDKVVSEFRRLERGRAGREDGALAATLTLGGGEVRATKLSPAQAARRDAIEKRIAALREQRGQMSEEGFLQALEPLARELASIYVEAVAP